LSSEERRGLVLALLERTLAILRSSRVIRVSLVATSDSEVIAFARSLGAETVRESRPGHNRALDEARRVARRLYPSSAPLVLAADLPWLSVDDVISISQRATGKRVLVIAPDVAGNGTNALAGWPVERVRFAFGTNSFDEHATQASKNDWSLELYRSLGTGRDLDTPADLARLTFDQSGLDLKGESDRVLIGRQSPF
jgi:2-phospho-L-lactate guanylyltransferase